MELTMKGKGICTIFGSLLLEFIFGSIYTWSSINSYYMSYLKENGNPTIQIVDGYFMVPIIMTIGMLFGIIGTKLELILGVKKCLFISLSLIITAHLILLYYTNIFIIYTAMTLFGMGYGFSMLIVLKNCWMFFPDNKGLVSGVILFGLGSSSSLFTSIADIIINPLNKKVDPQTGFFTKEISAKTYNFIFILIIIIGILSITGFTLIFDYSSIPKESKHSIKIREVNDNVHLIANIIKVKEDKEIKSPVRQAFANIKIWQLTIMNFCSLYACFLCMNTYRSFGQLNFMDESLLSLLSKINPLINGFGRIIWGILSDHFPFKYLYSFLLLSTIGFTVSFYYVISYPYIYFALVCIIAFIFSGSICVLVPMYPKIYGIKYSSMISSISVAISGFNTIVSPIIAKQIIKGKEDYKLLYFTGTILAVVSLFVCISFKDVKFRYDEEKDDAEEQELITKN